MPRAGDLLVGEAASAVRVTALAVKQLDDGRELTLYRSATPGCASVLPVPQPWMTSGATRARRDLLGSRSGMGLATILRAAGIVTGVRGGGVQAATGRWRRRPGGDRSLEYVNH